MVDDQHWGLGKEHNKVMNVSEKDISPTRIK